MSSELQFIVVVSAASGAFIFTNLIGYIVEYRKQIQVNTDFTFRDAISNVFPEMMEFSGITMWIAIFISLFFVL